MDLSLSETQTMIQTAANEFMETELPKSRVLEIDESPSGFAPDLWEKMCEAGWAGMLIPEEYGGSDNSFMDVGVLYEVMGYHACASPHLSSAVLCAHTILEAGNESQKQDLLPGIVSGQRIFAFAFTEPEYGWGAGGVQMQATRLGENYVVDGTKLFIPDANVADQLLVVARTSQGQTLEQGVTLFAVDKSAPGVSVRVLTGWMGPKMCEVSFDNVEVPASGVLGAADEAWPAIENALDKATAVLSAYMAGGTRRVYEMALEYSQTRIAFGVPIGTFQRVQDHVIQALTEADASKWTSYEALWKLDEGLPEAALGISMAKAVSSVGFPKACEAAHHVYAGIGTDLELGLTQYTMRARTLQHYLGDAIYHRKRMARLMGTQKPTS